MDKFRDQPPELPQWLMKSENYIPQKDKDTFVDRSILSVFKVISRIKTQDYVSTSLPQVNTSLMVFFTFVLLLLISITKSLVFIGIVGVYLLVVLSLMKADSLVKVLKMSLGVTLITLIIMLPAILWGNYYSCIMITSKVLVTITAIGILSVNTRWNAITGALKRFYIPDIFIFILDITIKYMYLLGEFALHMLYALRLRSVGRNSSKYSSMAGIAGTVFLQSKEMAEDMYHAMECRGFTGEYPVFHKSKLRLPDYLYIVLNLGFLLLFIYFTRI